MIKKNIVKFIPILAIVTIVSGIGYSLILQNGDQTLSSLYLAFLYMPTPLFSLAIFSLIKKKDFVTKHIKNHGINLYSLLYTIGIFITWAITTIILTFVLSNIFPDFFGSFVSNSQDLLNNISGLLTQFGQSTTDLELPPAPILLLVLSMFSAIGAGFTVNLIFAFGEEIVWRGFFWDELKQYSNIKISMVTGLVWGLWHAPIILQGYNYGQDDAIVGSIFFILFCIAFSFLFTHVMRNTKSKVMAAGLHGMFNAYAGVFLIMIIDINFFVDGAIGLTSIIAILITYLIFIFVSKWYQSLKKG